MSSGNAAAENSITRFFPWRVPLAADWTDKWRQADADVRNLSVGKSVDVDALCIVLRKLAGQQLGTSEQLKLEGTARRLLSITIPLKPLRKFHVGLIGNRTLSYVVNPLRAAGLARGLLLDASEAPYDSAASFAYGHAELLAGKKLDAAVIVLDEGAFTRHNHLLNAAEEDQALAEAEEFMDRLAAMAHGKLRVPAVVATIPAPMRISSADLAVAGSEARFVMRLNEMIIAGAVRRDWILWDLADLSARVGQVGWSDPIRFHEAKIPFRIELCPLVADHLCRLIAAMSGKACRALVLDLDNTLWGGIIGDDGLDGIRLGHNSPEGEAYLAFQRFVLELRRRGVVIVVCTKNTDEIAREPFRSHPEMLLREEHIAVFQANWDDKATNLNAIAETLDLGLESICFVDDNPAERERVRQELPLVSVPEIGEDPALFPSLIADSGVFEHVLLNADDLGRAASYESNARRVELRTKIGNYDEYLKSLHMTLTLSRFDSVGRPRIAQLINKSNQFNLTTQRYSEEDVKRFEADRAGILCWQARLDDAFGSHGIIGIVIVRTEPKIWTIDTWLMSCRVLMRGVEETLMNLLAERARTAGVEKIVGEYIPTNRNSLVSEFYPKLGFAQVPGDRADGAETYSCKPASWKPLESFIALSISADA